MAHFYGSLKGSRGGVSRLAGKDAGISVTAAGWSGCAHMRLRQQDGVDWLTVSLGRWNGKGTERTIYDGPVDGAAAPTKVRSGKR